MAIAIKQQGSGINWFWIISIILFFIILLVGTYYLFFSPTPFIETIIPNEIKKTSQISEINIDSNQIRSVTEHPVTKKLRQYVSPPDFGFFGRQNPFLTF